MKQAASGARSWAGSATALTGLDQRDVLVLSLYYNEELTYVEIAEVLGVTTSRVCQLHGRAIARLRAELELIQPAAARRDPSSAASAGPAGSPVSPSPVKREGKANAAKREAAHG
jgi:hypothetical protein